jgi:hypothetical protein
MSQFFPYAVDKRFFPMWAPFGLRPSRDGVTLSDDGQFVAKYGWLTLATALDNVTGAHITRHYRWWTAVGIRGSLVDDGLTFGTNQSGGVCVHFREKVPTVFRRRGHSALTVTVVDLEGLERALSSPGTGDDTEATSTEG